MALVLVGCAHTGKPMVDVPNVIGMTRAQAVHELAAKHLVPRTRVVASSHQVGTVVVEGPAAGVKVARNSTVTISVSAEISAAPVSAAHIAANLGQCPKRYTDATLGTLNAGIKGLDKLIVPISAVVVRICKYGLAPDANSIPSGLVASGVGVLTPPAATAFEAETNRLPRADAPIPCPATGPPFFFLTFANATQRVDVWEAGGCGFKTNGTISVGTTTHWSNELAHETTSTAGSH